MTTYEKAATTVVEYAGFEVVRSAAPEEVRRIAVGALGGLAEWLNTTPGGRTSLTAEDLARICETIEDWT